MATFAQLLQTLKNGSYTGGWGAIAAFDGATIAPLFADYYAAMIHGHDAVRPIAKDPQTIPFTESQDLFATIHNVVLAAPQLSLAGGSLQNPKVLLTYALSQGVYSERSRNPGSPEKVVRLTNLAAGATHTLTVELDLTDAVGRIDAQGTAWLTLGAASNPVCSVGSSDVAKRKVGEWLLEALGARQTGPIQLALGHLVAERSFTRPASFMLRPQAGPAGTSGALLVLITRPDGTPGLIPNQASFPYLIPEGRDSSNSPYSATLLVARDYPTLIEGEAEQLFGQILFPNEQYFKADSIHRDTRDIVLFGNVKRRPAQASDQQVGRYLPGATSQLMTVSAGPSAFPVTLIASSSTTTGWTWELPQPALGTLVDQPGAGAIYTPPASLPADTSISLQRVIATNRGTGERYEACLVIQAPYAPVVEFDRTLVSDVPLGVAITLWHDLELDDYSEQWHVVGRGTVEDASPAAPGKRRYRAPAEAGDDIELLVCRIFSPSGRLAGYGYAIIQLGQTNEPGQWPEPEPFKIRAKHTGAVPYANGLQQFEIEVEIGTGTNQPDMTDAEFATLRLAVRGGADLPLIPSTLEGLPLDIDGVSAPWGYKLERNDYLLAGNTNAAADVQAAKGSTRFKTFYLHTTATSPATFIARITDANNKVHSSSESGDGEGQERTLTVDRRPVPTWSQDLSRIPRKRVAGGYLDLGQPADPNYTIENPNYDWHLRTCDYWTIAQHINQQPVRIVRLQIHSDGPPIKWESEQNNEDLFSYIGYALIKDASNPRNLKFASVVSDPLLYLPKVFEGTPQHAVIDHASAPAPGQLLLSVNRVMEVFYRQRAAIKEAAGGTFDFEQPVSFSLWDEYGNRYGLQVSFESLNRDKLQVRQV